MVRKFKPVDEAAINAEFSALQSLDFAKLAYAMERYQDSFKDVHPAVIKGGYEHGILEIRHESGAYKGRGLFWPETSKSLILLTVFAKESNKTPEAIKKLAYARLADYKQR